MGDLDDAKTAKVQLMDGKWVFAIFDAFGTNLAQWLVPRFGPDNFFMPSSSGDPAGLDYVGPVLEEHGLRYTSWQGNARDGWTTSLDHF
ncbi:hypothetical protein NVV95_17960 [Herbiconiux sp. CPCC 205716]|uniref:Uncharacterized protein n=1 Tax=Herbiconiux gentiana TaxID=2970912 RepID=A0ABT2GJZ7_9MICO|nr:hypothetical protein [Herbiconiux gentiana]MCS5716436.1 hypothetical protein [Herbiconiux gentiana]